VEKSEGKLWVEKSEVLAGIESGAWKLTGVGGVGGTSMGADIEMRNTGGAGAQSFGVNVSAGALDSFCAGSRMVPAKRAHGE
jgi:hypothetical protein